MAIPFLNNISLNNNEIQNVKLHNTGTIPSPAAGHIYFDTDDNIAKYYNGSAWIDLITNTDVDVSVANLITRLGQISENVTIGDAADVTVIIPGDLQVTGTTTTNNVETVSTSNGVIFEGNAADANELTLLAGTLTADRTITLPDLSGTVVLETFVQIQTDSGTLVANSDRDTMSIIGGGAIETSGNAATDVILISHADTSSQASVDNSGVTVIQDVTLDTYGHVTGLASVDLTSGINSLIDTKISAAGYAATITDSVSGTAFNHGLGEDVIVQLYDVTTKETVYADVERNGNYLNITFASTPTNSIRVLVQQIN